MDDINQFDQFVALHKPQLTSSAIPQHLWQALYTKITTETFDAGEALQLMLIEYDDDEDTESDDDNAPGAVFALAVAREQGLSAADANSIYLIDHAWTFRVQIARKQLEQYSHLTDRLCAITGIDLEHPQRVEKVLRRIWRYCHAYSLSGSEALTDEERQPIWYVMDEVGSAVQHSDAPNFRIVPFLHLQTQTTYSLLFPVQDCVYGEQVTRDFVEYVAPNAPEREVLLLPWRAADLTAESFTQEEPSAEYFSSGHISETYPSANEQQKPNVNRNEPLKVYAEYDVLREHLNASAFELVDTPADADVLWLTQHFKEFGELARETPNKFINQFPFEYVLTIKDLLSITCRRAAPVEGAFDAKTLVSLPRWLPTTFNLKTELLQFAAYFQRRAALGLDNHWIIKPWNLARGLDTHITDSLTQIVRLPATGPKIAQKYIERPVLFHRNELDAQVKFDIRYVILLKSAQPLEAYIHRKFFLRFANQGFSLDHFDTYEKHFTVMNYQEEAELRHIKCDDFIAMWQQQYPTHSWSKLENDICAMLHELLVCATKCPPPCGITACAQSRALYAADIMLEWSSIDNDEVDGAKEKQQLKMQPKLLEVNWTPDCKRACDYYPEFFNDIFKLLFLDEGNDDSFRLLGAEGVSGAGGDS